MSYAGRQTWYSTTETDDDPQNQPDNDPNEEWGRFGSPFNPNTDWSQREFPAVDRALESVGADFDNAQDFYDQVSGPGVSDTQYDITGDGQVDIFDAIAFNRAAVTGGFNAEQYARNREDASGSAQPNSDPQSGSEQPGYAGRIPQYAQTDDESTVVDESNPYANDPVPTSSPDQGGMGRATMLMLGLSGLAGLWVVSR